MCAKQLHLKKKKYSGPKNCAGEAYCKKLEYPTNDDAETIYWTCNDGDINPYEDQIPIGATCYTRCNKNEKGVEIEFIAKCVDDEDPTSETKGKWDLSEAGDYDPANPDSSICQCPKFHLWYNPNVEDGAIFSCTTAIEFPEDPNVAIDTEIEKTNRCALICGYEVVRDIFCHNGQWNDAEEDEYKEGGNGIGCYNRPTTTTTTTETPDE